MKRQQMLQRIDWALIIVTCMLVVWGLLMVYSAVHQNPQLIILVQKQSVAAAAGILIMLIFTTVNYQLLSQYSWGLYAVSLILLALVLVFGRSVHGSRSWFMMGRWGFQPTEIAKLTTTVLLAHIAEKRMRDGMFRYYNSFLLPAAVAFVPVLLIMLQPDPGSAALFIPLLAGFMFMAGIAPLYLVLAGVFAVSAAGGVLGYIYSGMIGPGENVSIFMRILRFCMCPFSGWMIVVGFVCAVFIGYFVLRKLRFSVPISWPVLFSAAGGGGLAAARVLVWVLKEYQKQRILTFINPYFDPLGAGYNVIQSQVAIGSGGMLGKGFFSGTQSQLGFLPLQHTDFIFSLVAEELGFIGAGFLLVLFAVMIYRIFRISRQARDPFGSMLAAGIGLMLSVQIFINIGMSMGITPVTGLPLPFISHGGSSLVTSLAAIGIVLSISLHRYTY